MSIYVTSCRSPSKETRIFCRLFSRLFPRGVFEPRGRKTVADVAARARKLGRQRAVFICEKTSMPAVLLFLDTQKDWSWLEPVIGLEKISWKAEPGRGIGVEGGLVEGSQSKLVEGLFFFEPVECMDDRVLAVVADSGSLSFRLDGKEMLLMKVSHTSIREERDAV